ncbi:MAG: ATP-binding protein, partial [Paramuribaculum sp.]|nr:ATP-binding protein [Paramuribaculum sp.]
HDDTWGEVVLMSGLPGTGKDTWISRNMPDNPMVSLDEIRRIHKIAPTSPQGFVANVAKEQAKEFLRRHQPFVWNATNLTADTRRKLISLFESYKARVRIVYLETDWQTQLLRNASRPDPVPLPVITSMLSKLTLPEAHEAAGVEWLTV